MREQFIRNGALLALALGFSFGTPVGVHASGQSHFGKVKTSKSAKSRSPASVTPERASEVRRALAHLDAAKGSGNREQYTQAVQALAKYPYRDVVKTLVERLGSELNEGRPNSYWLNAYLDALGTIGNKEYVPAVETMHRQAELELHGKIGNASTYVNSNFEKNIERMRARNGTLESLPEVALVAVSKDENVGEKVRKIASAGGKVSAMLSAIRRVMNDDVREQVAKSTWIPVIGRSKESDSVLDVLVRMKSKVPLLKGDPGVGKTVIVEDIVKRIIEGQLPEGIYQGELKDAVVIESSPSKISLLAKAFTPSAQSAAVEDFLKGVIEIQRELKRPVLVFLDEAHELTKDQMNGFKPFLESMNFDVRLILATTGKELGLTLANDEAFMRRIEPILVEEFDAEKTFEILKQTWVPALSKRYDVEYSDEVIRLAIELAPDLRPEMRRPAGPFGVLQDVGILKHRKFRGQPARLSEADLYRFTADKMGLPVVPQDRLAFEEYMEKVKAELKTEVIGQDRFIDHVVDRYKTSLTAKGKKHSVVMAMGTTGIGKSYGAERLAMRYYGNLNRYLEIDMTQFMDGSFSVNILFGAPNGVISSDKNKGVLCEFFDGKGKGGGIVVLNEIEKAHPDVLKRFMEVFDKGYIQCGDGRQRQVGRSMFIMTSNKGAKRFIPEDWVKSASSEEIRRRVDSITQEDMRKAFTDEESFAEKSKSVPPEVVQRVDEFIFLNPLDFGTAVEIARSKIDQFVKEHEKLYGKRLSVPENFAESLLKTTYDASVGARQINRMVEKYLGGIARQYFGEHKVDADLTVHLEMLPNQPSKTKLVAKDASGRSVSIEGPSLPLNNPLMDPEIRDRVKSIEAKLARVVIGQPEAVAKVAALVRAQAGSPDTPNPASIYLVGPTGTGKTEIAKAVAQSRFGRDEAIVIISMGEVKSEYDLNNIFAPPKGIVGGDTMGQFERFLEANPDGGVIVWDEMSNVGGGNKAIKNEIAKRLYTMLEEGKWTNNSGKTYDLRKYLFVFTGNDGEQLFEGHTSDDMLDAIWKDYGTDPSKLRKLLEDAGFPQAFLGRINEVVLMRPTPSSARIEIAKKLLKQWQGRFSSQPYDVVFADGVPETLAKLFYHPNQGARSMRNFINSKMASQVALAAVDLNWDDLTRTHERAKLVVSFKETSILNPFYRLRPDPVEAILNVDAEYGGKKVFESSLDVTRDARFMKQIPILDAWGTAFHEAGHAVLNDPSISGQVLAHLTIVPSDHFLGYARYDTIPNAVTNYSRKTVVARIAVLLAGSIAEERVGGESNSGKSGDLKQVRRLITKAAVEWGLEPRLYGVKVDAEGEPQLSSRQAQIFDEFSEKLIEDGDALARKLIEEKWLALRETAITLMKTGSIKGDEFQEILSKFEKLSPQKKTELMKEHSIDQVRQTLQSAGDACSQALLSPVL